MEQRQTMFSEFLHKGKGRNGLEAAGEVGKERSELFGLVFCTMRELSACVQADGKDLVREEKQGAQRFRGDMALRKERGWDLELTGHRI